MSKYDNLSHSQWMALLLGMHIRNELEDFHCENIPDGKMPELNSTIRYAIYDFFEQVLKSEDYIAWLAQMIPDYWEVPGIDDRPTRSSERQR
jgi:hypothetical protein